MVQKTCRFLAAALLCCVLAGCQSAAQSQSAAQPQQGSGSRGSEPFVLTPTADGAVVYQNDQVILDASHTDQGYIMVQYTGQNPKVKLQLSGPNQVTYTYTLHSGWEVFPLTSGSGEYQCNVFEQIAGTEYAYAFSQTFSAAISDETLPYLYPNQYVNFSADSKTVAEGAKLAAYANTDLDVVAAVYEEIVGSFTYDYDKAETVESGYLPNVDAILESRTGICFDYAAVMATMLRTQGIPTRLDVGWAGDIYHAWVSVYTPETGWIEGIIEFDGKQWKRMDPTFASNENQSSKIMQFINDDSNYTVKYTY